MFHLKYPCVERGYLGFFVIDYECSQENLYQEILISAYDLSKNLKCEDNEYIMIRNVWSDLLECSIRNIWEESVVGPIKLCDWDCLHFIKNLIVDK